MKIETPSALKDWQVKPVGDIFEINSEILPNSTSSDFRFRYITLESVYSERIDFESVQQVCFGEAPSRARRVIKRGDILVSTVRPNLQGFAEFQPPDDRPYICSTGFAVLRAKNGHDQQFYLQQLLSGFGASQFHAYVTGTNYPAISDRDFARLKLLVPKDKLEKDSSAAIRIITAAIAAARESIIKAERLQNGIMQQLLSGRIKPDGTPRRKDEFWTDQKLGLVPKGWIVEKGWKLADKITKGQSPKWQGFDYTTSGMLFVTSENVRDGFLDLSEPKFLPVQFNEKIKGSELRTGDVLINLVGASIGRSCIFHSDHRPANVNQAVCVFRPKPGIQSRYLGYYLRLQTTLNRLLSSQVETARSNLSLGDVRRLRFVLPRDEDEQTAIAGQVHQITRLIDTKKQKIAALQRLKKSMMQNLLTGRIRLPVESTAKKGK
jgi:type I restriction enzyme S subunit